MKEWTRKRKADVCMGILLQIYFLLSMDPYRRRVSHDSRVSDRDIPERSCIKAYNYIFLSRASNLMEIFRFCGSRHLP